MSVANRKLRRVAIFQRRFLPYSKRNSDAYCGVIRRVSLLLDTVELHRKTGPVIVGVPLVFVV